MVKDCCCGTTLLIKANPAIPPHLWVIITDPDGDPLLVVMVNMTSVRRGVDKTVLLKKGDHPFIKHNTAISYADAKITNADNLQYRINKGHFKKMAPLDKTILSRVQEGLLKSLRTPNNVLNYCKDYWGVE